VVGMCRPCRPGDIGLIDRPDHIEFRHGVTSSQLRYAVALSHHTNGLKEFITLWQQLSCRPSGVRAAGRFDGNSALCRRRRRVFG
jgi:hypothetical protein